MSLFRISYSDQAEEDGSVSNDRLRDEKDASGFINLAKNNDDDDGRDVYLLDNNLPISIIVIVGLIFLLFNLLACAGVYYQKQKVKRRL